MTIRIHSTQIEITRHDPWDYYGFYEVFPKDVVVPLAPDTREWEGTVKFKVWMSNNARVDVDLRELNGVIERAMNKYVADKEKTSPR